MSERRLMVVDDERDFAEFVSKAAIDLGYETRICTQQGDFQRIYAELSPTHIVLDVVMPAIDGIEIMHWLAQLRSTAEIIVITGYIPDYAKLAGLERAVRALQA